MFQYYYKQCPTCHHFTLRNTTQCVSSSSESTTSTEREQDLFVDLQNMNLSNYYEDSFFDRSLAIDEAVQVPQEIPQGQVQDTDLYVETPIMSVPKYVKFKLD